MTDDQLDALARHAEYGHLEGQDYDAVLELVAEVRKLRDGIRMMCERWDREHPDGFAFEVTSDFRDLLDGKERGRTVGGYPSSGRHASTLDSPPSGPAPGGKR